MFLSVFGHTNVDFIIRVDEIPADGSVPVLGTLKRPGGTAWNIAYVAGMLGVDVEIFSRVGDDFPREYIEKLKNWGVNTKNLNVVRGYGMTPVCFIVSDGKKQIAFIDQGPMGRLMDYENKPEGEWVHFSTGLPEEYMGIKKITKARISFDPGQEIHYRYTKESFTEMIDGAHIFFANEVEYRKALEFMTEEEILKRAGNVIITLGEKGCVLMNKTGKLKIPAYRVDGKESIGAGDSFRAGFYAGMKAGLDMYDSCRLAMKVASLIVSHGGIPDELPSPRELIQSL